MSFQKFELFVQEGIDYEDLPEEKGLHILQALTS